MIYVANDAKSRFRSRLETREKARTARLGRKLTAGKYVSCVRGAVVCVAFHRCRLMIVICVIIVVIGSFICALLKARLDERQEDLSMKRQSRLSLRRRQCSEVQGIHNDPEISNDESFSLSSNIRTSAKECANVTNHGTVKGPNSVIDVSECNLKHAHDISDDSSSDEKVIVIDDVCDNDFKKSSSMFNWNKTFPNQLYQNIESSSSRKTMPLEAPNKRQKLMNDPPSSIDSSSSDDEFINSNKDDSPKVAIQHTMMIAGIKVNLPVKPYPCQIAVMNSLIQGCTKEQNCLLESPTGSGKTLALLCGALAWQEQYSEKICREKSDGTDKESSCDDNDDSLKDNFFLNSSQYFAEELLDKISCKDKARKVPKIYYGTRTHKQIEQVVRELKKTVYKHKRMTILSSRQHTCIQKSNRNKNELCNELLDPLKIKKCPYYNEHSKRKAVAFNNMKTPWDIEDLVSLGNDIGSCPYFGARSLMADAEIIFCPYNYVLDPDIRESMQIDLKGNIVILDEAHNVEDMCREAASVTLRDDEIAIAAKECQDLFHKMQANGCERHIYTTLQEYLTDIVKFLKNIDVEENALGFDSGMISQTWLGMEVRVLLDVNNIGCSRFPNFLAASTAAIQDFTKNMKEEIYFEKMMPTISRDTKKILEYLCFAIQMIISDICVNDYRMYVTETFESIKNATDDVWSSSKAKVRTMKLICMNPAIVFAPLERTVRSVIVASGTLTPTTSFQSELGTQFPHIVNPNHIIPKDQVYIRCISRGPKGVSLMAKHTTVNSWSFQDELGNLILQVCDSVPHGVLCFFSSYKTMNTIHDRWKNNGMWRKLSELKEIFVEPKTNKDLFIEMTKYRRVIEESSSKSFRATHGAILFAVCRGKVAEGIDFSDNEARCVLAVGIPYLLQNNDIQMKMEYNNLNKSKGLLSGSEWYTINAFRAVNQAIGRCVRHKGDWGAVLLVDERYQITRFTNYLPKWIRTGMQLDSNYDLETELQDFVTMQIAREKGEKCIEN